MFLDQNFARIPNLLSEKYFSHNFFCIQCINIFMLYFVLEKYYMLLSWIKFTKFRSQTALNSN